MKTNGPVEKLLDISRIHALRWRIRIHLRGNVRSPNERAVAIRVVESR